MNSHIYSQDHAQFLSLSCEFAQPLDTLKAVPNIIIDARRLSCPLPLLKLKIALKTAQDGDVIYLLTDLSQAHDDIMLFCQKNHHHYQSHTDTFFHGIITKNPSKNTAI